MRTSVVPFDAGHRPAVRDLLLAHGWGEPLVEDQLGMVDWLSEEPVEGQTFSALVRHEPVGFASVQFHHRNRMAQVQGLAVRPDLQRGGIGTALVRRIEDAATAWGARGVFADTPTTNQGGRAFWEALGYRAAYVMPRYYADGVDGVTYQLFFDAPT